IRFGLTAVKGVGTHVVEEISKEREENGLYKNLWDFCERLDSINRREVEALIKVGAFDSTGQPRKGLLQVAEDALKQSKAMRKKKAEGQGSLFDALSGGPEDALNALEALDAPTVPDEEFDEMEKF